MERQSQERKDNRRLLSCVRCGECERDWLSKLQSPVLRGPSEARRKEFGNITDHPVYLGGQEADGSRYLERWHKAQNRNTHKNSGSRFWNQRAQIHLLVKEDRRSSVRVGEWGPKTIRGFCHPPGLVLSHGIHFLAL